MKRLFKSSNFWNAVIATIIITVASYFFKVDTSILLVIGSLFGGRTIATGVQDYMTSKYEWNDQPNPDHEEH